MIIKRRMSGPVPPQKWDREEAAIAAKIRDGSYNVVGVHATCGDDYYSSGNYGSNYGMTGGQKKERHELCLQMDHEEMLKDPWYAELRRIAELHQAMLKLRSADRAEYLKVYDAYVAEVREASKADIAERARRDAEWLAATEMDEKNDPSNQHT